MARDIRKTTQYKREYALIVKQLDELFANDNSCENDPIYKRAIELGRDKHLPLVKAIEIAEKEFANK